MTDDSSASSFADERLAAHRWAADLAGLPWPERLRRVRKDRAFANPSFIALSISLGRDFGLAPAERQQWAQFAVEAALRGRSRRAEELEPLAWAVLGNAHRVRGRLSPSRAAFKRCHPLRRRMADVLELADTYSLEAAFWWDIAGWSHRGGRASRLGRDGQVALTRAAELIDEALRLATPNATATVIGCFEVQAGNIALQAERRSVATTMYLSAVDRFDPVGYPRLALEVSHNLAKTAIDSGRLDLAESAIGRLQSRYHVVGYPKLSLQGSWLVARIARGRGQLRDAMMLLNAVRDRFMEHGMILEAADVDLEMAELASETGRSAEAAHLARRAARLLARTRDPFAAQMAAQLPRRYYRRAP